MQIFALRSADFLNRVVGRERNAGNRRFGRDVHMALVALEARLEFDGAGRQVHVFLRNGAEPVLCVLAAGFGFELVCADGRRDAASDGPFEKAEDLAAFLAVLGILGDVDVGAARLVGDAGVVGHGFVELLLGGV